VAADDDQDTLEALAVALRVLGHHVVAEARTGQQLVERCRAFCPDLIVADIDMPRLDGIAAVREVCRHRPTPVVVVCAYHDLESQEHARHECVMAYLVKPVGPEDLGPAISLAWWRFGLFQGSAASQPARSAPVGGRLVSRGSVHKTPPVDNAMAVRLPSQR